MEEEKGVTEHEENDTQIPTSDKEDEDITRMDPLANTDGIRMQFDALLAEYNMVRSLVASERQIQSQLDSITLTALGLSVPLILFVVEQSLDFGGIVLLLPVLFFAIVFTQTRYERAIVTHAIYIDSELRPSMIKLLSFTKVKQVGILGFEAFLARDSFLRSIFLEWAATASRAVLGFAAGITVMVTYVYLRQTVMNSPWQSYEIILLLIDMILLVGNLVNTYLVARQRSAYLTKQSYFK